MQNKQKETKRKESKLKNVSVYHLHRNLRWNHSRSFVYLRKKKKPLRIVVNT